MNQRKIIISAFLLMMVFGTQTVVAKESIDKEALKTAIKELNIEDIQELKTSLEAVVIDDAKKTGYTSLVPGGGGGGFLMLFPDKINVNKFDQVDNITTLYGGAGGFYYHLNEQISLGGYFGGFGGISEKKVGDDYYEYAVGAGFQMATVKYRPIITDQFIIDLDAGVGLISGGFSKYQTNEALTGVDISRSASMKLAYLVGAEMRYRIDNLWTIGLKGGYLSADLGKLGRAGTEDANTSLDLSAPYLAITMNGNM